MTYSCSFVAEEASLAAIAIAITITAVVVVAVVVVVTVDGDAAGTIVAIDAAAAVARQTYSSRTTTGIVSAVVASSTVLRQLSCSRCCDLSFCLVSCSEVQVLQTRCHRAPVMRSLVDCSLIGQVVGYGLCGGLSDRESHSCRQISGLAYHWPNPPS